MAGALLLLWPTHGFAESLYDAIELAYQTNPVLRGQRAELRAIDETYVQARAGYGPQVSVSGQGGYQSARIDQPGAVGGKTFSTNSATTGSADLSLVQPLYTGGATSARVQGAAADVLAGRQKLRQTESEVLQNVITAYMDVRRDRETLKILGDEIAALSAEVEETRAKGKLGELTRADVALAEARYLSAKSQFVLAQGRLNASNAEYLRVVGQNPGELAPEPQFGVLPANLDQALDAAQHNNPQVLGAVQTELAARERTRQARAANGLTLSVRMDAAIAPIEPYIPHDYDRSVGAVVMFNQPLFTSGLNASRVREALERDNRAALDVDATQRSVAQTVAQAWEQLVALRSALALEVQQLEAERVAVEGARLEERVGLRSTIDLLNVELELANARLTLVQNRHDEYLAQTAVLAGVGLLEAQLLVPNTAAYHPEASLARAAKVGAAPWEGAIGSLDRIGSPAPRPSQMLPADAGPPHPANASPLPPATP